MIHKEMAHARNAFARHVIATSSEGRWLLREPGTSIFWVEVVVLAGGYLLVYGDIRPVLFGCYHASKDALPAAVARQTVLWMGQRTRPDDRYFIEKARIGGTADETIWTPDDDVMRAEIDELIAETRSTEAEEEDATDNPYKIRREALEDARDSVGSVSHDETRHAVYDALDGDAEGVPRGAKISSAMIYAHAALQCLVRMLEGREQGVP